MTGSPGVGKTTVLTKTVDSLRQRGYKIGGMISREIRENGVRVGFEITDRNSERRGWLAHINQKDGPRVGKYSVNLEDLDTVGVQAITDATKNCNVIVIDEIGPMELFSKKFRNVVQESLESPKVVIAVVHWKARDELIAKTKNRMDAETFTVTAENRDYLDELLIEKAVEELKQKLNHRF